MKFVNPFRGIGIDTSRYRRNIGRIFSVVLSIIPMILLYLGVTAVNELLPQGKSPDFFKLDPTSLVLTTLMAILIVLPAFKFIYAWVKHRVLSVPDKLVMIGMWSMAIPSFVPLVFMPRKLSLDNVRFAISLTTFSRWFTLAFLIFGFVASMYVIRDLLRKSPWFMPLMVVPYIGVYYVTVTQYNAFNDLIRGANFTTKQLYEMLTTFKGDLLLMNTAPFTMFALAGALLIFWIGAEGYVFIWQKTKNWRR